MEVCVGGKQESGLMKSTAEAIDWFHLKFKPHEQCSDNFRYVSPEWAGDCRRVKQTTVTPNQRAETKKKKNRDNAARLVQHQRNTDTWLGLVLLVGPTISH